MEICVVAINYPTEKRQIHVFLDNLVRKFVDRGIKCNVIAPQSSFSYYKRKDLRRDLVSERFTDAGNKYMVYSPLFTVFPTAKIGEVCLADFSKKSFYHAIKNVYKKNGFKADLIYSHFFQAGISAVMLGRKLNVPVYIANGEADTISETRYFSRRLLKRTLDDVTGIISVSTKCKEEVGKLCDNNPEILKKIQIIPNAADLKKFYHMNRSECRQELNFPKDAFIVAFTGSFIPRKGIQKLASAINNIEDTYGIFIGSGEDKPDCKKILFEGRVQNSEMVRYLNAADVFCLPTQAEGCCNAIVEAVCCGLPIISSNRSFNWDILDSSCSVLIDPDNEREIESALKELKNNSSKRQSLSDGSLTRAKELSLDSRTDKILDFIKVDK